MPLKLSENQKYMKEITAAAAKSLQLCLTLCDPMDGSPPGSSVPGIPQARVLEWVAVSFSVNLLTCAVKALHCLNLLCSQHFHE